MPASTGDLFPPSAVSPVSEDHGESKVKQHDNAKHDPVISKYLEIMILDVF